MPVTIESVTPGASQATDKLMVRRGAGPGDHTIELIDGVGSAQIADLAVTTAELAANATTNAKLAQMATARVKGRATAGTGDPEDLTGAQVLALLPAPGTTGKVIFNSAGAFAGAADVEIETGQLRLPSISIPAAPAAGGLKLFGESVGGQILPAFRAPTGLAKPLQAYMGQGRVAFARPPGNGTTAPQTVGLLITGLGTATGANNATTNRHARMARIEYLVTVAATTAVAGWRVSNAQWTVGAATAGDGGFFTSIVWGPATGVATTTTRAFAGMRPANASTDVEPSSIANICGMGWDAADTNIQFMYNDATGTASKVGLGASFPVPTVDRTSVYQIDMYSPPGTTQSVSYVITDLVSGAVASGTVTTDLPANTVFLAPHNYISVGGTSSVIGLAFMNCHIESDYA